MKAMYGMMAAAMLAAATARADSIPAARGLIASNSIDRTASCRYYKAWYIDGCDKAELDAILKRNVEGHRRWLAIASKDALPARCDLGLAYAAIGKWKEAREEIAPVLAAVDGGRHMDAPRQAQANWEMANMLWLDGDKEGAKKRLAKAAALHRTGKVDDFLAVTGRSKYLLSMMNDPDWDVDALKLPHSADGRPFPTPQKAEYGDAKVSLAKVEIDTRVSRADPIVRLLKRKLRRFGSAFAPGGTTIEVSLSPDAPVDKPQGYSLEVAPGSVRIMARTRLGLTWGVVSFLQCVDRGDAQDGKPSIRTCTIEDWPRCVKRGVTPYWEPEYLEYALFYKMKVVDFTMNRQYLLSPLDKELFRTVASRFADFGIEVNVYTDSIDVRPLPPYSSPRTWKIHLAWAKYLASIGMGNIIMMDDNRFPMHPKDVEAAGTAANLDAKFVTKLYREVKKTYPDFRMEFCPPFYWGPHGGVSYPEPRDEYLKSLARDLDPEIDVFWTGPYVKTSGMNEETVGWITKLIGRKPAANSNGNSIGQHNYCQFGADVAGYKTSHATNLFDMVASFRQNTSRYAEACAIGSCMDWCWNPDAHDPRTAARRSIDIVEGPGVFEALDEAMPAMSYFDKYVYGRPRVEVLTEDQADLDAKVAAGEAAWRKAMSLAKNGGMFVADFNKFGITWAKNIAEARRNPPEAFQKEREAIMANTVFAKNEAGYDAEKGDEFFPAELLTGGIIVHNFSSRTPGGNRTVKYVDPGASASGRFTCDLFPPEHPFKLFVTGTSYIDEKPVLEVSVNGIVVWKGEAFERYRFTVKEIEIPVVALKRNNTLVLKCDSPAGTRRKAVIHYAVIKK